jgi:hypothetical protein
MSVHVISDRSLMRDGYSYEEAPGGGFIGIPVAEIDSREMVRRSDEYSPMVKSVMERFWAALDRRRGRQ